MLKRPGPVSSGACQEQKCGFWEWGPRGRWLGIAAFLGVVVVAAAVPLLALPGPGFSSVALLETVSSQGGAATVAPPPTITQTLDREAALSNQGAADRKAPPPAVIQSAALEQMPSIQGGVDRIDPSPAITQQDLLSALLRYGARPEGSSPAFFPAVDVLLATPDYFSQTGRQPPTLPAEPSLIFYVAEHVHIDELPESPPGPLLRVGETYWQPTEITMLTNSPHHRMTLIRYRAKRAGGEPLITSEVPSIELVFPPAAGNTIPPSTLTWELPIAYSPTYSSRDLYIPSGS